MRSPKEVPLRRRMCRARPAEVPPRLNRPKWLVARQASGWPQPQALLSKRVVLMGAGRRLNVWRLLSGLKGSRLSAYFSPEGRAKLCIALVSEDRSSAAERLIFAVQA